jgi:phosphoribosylamine---glycine ligase
VDDDPYVLEINVRFGDPEAQGLLALLHSSFLELNWACATGQLSAIKPSWYKPGKMVSFVLALVSDGYPGPYQKGYEIFGIDQARLMDGVYQVLHAGTKLENGAWVNAGGRVLYIVTRARTLSKAAETAYKAAERIHWEGRDYRRDIGQRVLTA